MTPPRREGGTPARERKRERGQAHTLEGVVAALILLSAIVFALELTAVTPLSASTSSQHIENQQEATARGILGAAAESGALKRTLLSWNDSEGRFWNSTDRTESVYFETNPPPTEFGGMLNRSFDSGGIAYNVYLRFNASEDPSLKRLVYQGRPSDNAVSASWPVTLYRNDKLHDHEEQPTGTNVSDSSTFYAEDRTGSSVYKVIHVEVVVWRI
ncbi:MAG: hypothetical protein V5A28_02420 [Haloarculaceae archaeon]